MDLGNPELELIDPTPNIHALFLQFDKIFFWTKLASRAVVRWSKRMYSCAGVCSYEGRGGLCDIALSEPLLKLRPRKDLIETLLHEMIHAFLFITCRDQDRDGHGPNFKAHMHRINKSAGLNISIYHDFHDEVKLYQTHWWRCNGPCQTRKPYFGIVRRSANRTPGPNDFWWSDHQRKCGGTFVKIKEPEKQNKGKKTKAKPNADITKYINNTQTSKTGSKIVTINSDKTKPVLKNVSNVMTKSNNASTVVITKKGVDSSPKNKTNQIKNNPPILFSGKGQTINGDGNKSDTSVLETVRSIWANKTLPSTIANSKPNNLLKNKSIITHDTSLNTTRNSKKHKAEFTSDSPPKKVKKIDDYFINTAKSVLKDIYGQDFNVTHSSENDNKLVVVSTETSNDSNLVECPICSMKVSSDIINRHLDECLNKDVIQELSKDNDQLDLSLDSFDKGKTEDKQDSALVSTYVTEIDNNKQRVSNNFVASTSNIPEENSPGDNNIPMIKIEPGTSKDITEQKCPCCDTKVIKPMEEHLDECLAFFDNNTTIPEEGASTSFIETIVIDDDEEDEFDETLTLNATGTKCPCPCCLEMVEHAEMNEHLDRCLS